MLGEIQASPCWELEAAKLAEHSFAVPVCLSVFEKFEVTKGEQHIYERFIQRGGHKAILCYHGTFESGIRLEYAPHGNIRSYLEDHPVQLAEALNFTHQCGVIHGDVNGFNVLLDRSLDVKLSDFAGSSLDGSPLLVGVTASHEYPGPLLSVEADIFALGSTLYELLNESRPYAGLTDKLILDHYSQGKFPDTDSLGSIGSVIRKCWRGEYKECSQVVNDLKAARQHLLVSTSHSRYPTKHTSTYAVLLVATIAVVTASVLMKLKLSRSH